MATPPAVQVGHFDEALGCFRDMLSPTSPTRPTASTFNTMMSMFMRQGRCEQVGWAGEGCRWGLAAGGELLCVCECLVWMVGGGWWGGIPVRQERGLASQSHNMHSLCTDFSLGRRSVLLLTTCWLRVSGRGDSPY